MASKSATKNAKQPKDLTAIKKWWKTRSSDGFLALSPPTSDRMTTGEGHEDAADELDAAHLADDTPYAFWQWQSQQRAFNSKGALIDDLLIHYNGEIATIADALGKPPAPFELVVPEAGTAFRLTQDYPLGDASSSRDRESTVPRLERSRLRRELTEPEIEWLRTAATEYVDEEALTVLIGCGAASADDVLAVYPPDEPDDDLLADAIDALHRIGADELGDAVERGFQCAPQSEAHLAALAASSSDATEDELRQLATIGAPDAARALLTRWLRAGEPQQEPIERAVSVTGEPALTDLMLTWAAYRAGSDSQPAQHHGLISLVHDEMLDDNWRAQAARTAAFIREVELGEIPERLIAPARIAEIDPQVLDRRPDAPAALRPSDRQELWKATMAYSPWQMAAYPTFLRTDLEQTRAHFERAFSSPERHPAFTSYYFWMPDDEAAAFDESGALVGVLPIYWGADRAEVAAELTDQLSLGFELREPTDPVAPLELVSSELPSYAETIDALRQGEHGGLGNEEAIGYLQGTVCRYAVRPAAHATTAEERFAFDLWRVVDGATLRGGARLLSVAEARQIIDEVYTEPDGAAVTWENGWPYLPISEQGGEIVWADYREQPPTVVQGAAEADKRTTAPSVRAWLKDALTSRP